jgi:hypothetical protein
MPKTSRKEVKALLPFLIIIVATRPLMFLTSYEVYPKLRVANQRSGIEGKISIPD